jgi:acetyltransferase-like isoleucine patch superfamily enzyme
MTRNEEMDRLLKDIDYSVNLDSFTNRLIFKMWQMFSSMRRRYYTFLYRRMINIGKGTKIYGRLFISNPQNITIGKDCYISEGVILNARDIIIIGNRVHLSSGSMLITSKLIKDNEHHSTPIIIKDGSWVASGAIICPGVILGENSVLGAGAVAVKNIPNNSLALGVPAKPK